MDDFRLKLASNCASFHRASRMVRSVKLVWLAREEIRAAPLETGFYISSFQFRHRIARGRPDRANLDGAGDFRVAVVDEVRE